MPTLKFHTIKWLDGQLEILDQTLLPAQEKYIRLSDVNEIITAIKTLQLRGAPLIGVAAAYAVAMAASTCRSRSEFAVAVNEIKSARPTAVNLSWAVERMLISYHAFTEAPNRAERLLEQAQRIHQEDAEMCERIGVLGAELMPEDGAVLTHCNAGALATAGCGTALGVIYEATRQGKKLSVFADETRPVLQGSRLTAWELMREGIDVTLITDSMAGHLMSRHIIDCVIVGADRIAINYDVANKIGTYSLAVLAKEHGIPFYVAAPASTFDRQIASGIDIEIEQRNSSEVTNCGGFAIAPEHIRVYNPAFDVTPTHLITAIITDREIIRCKRWADRTDL
jgi:methylthioribose-1-phosphate isomerase